MMKMTDVKNSLFPDNEAATRAVVGIALILGGSFVLLDQLTHWSWFMPLSVFAGGCVLLLGGVRLRQLGLIISGWIVVGIGAGIFIAAILPATWSLLQRIGWVLVFSSSGFGMIPWSTSQRYQYAGWWAWFPMAIVGTTGICFLIHPFQMANFILFPALGLGIVFIGLGVIKRWIGFVIPGSLLVVSGLGVYIPWIMRFTPNSLTRTGTMLVIFAFGWVLISVLSRSITHQFVWWPLIPGGVLAVVGWGLYIGGDPNSALTFIGNTGTIVLIILGIYLLLLRRGIRE